MSACPAPRRSRPRRAALAEAAAFEAAPEAAALCRGDGRVLVLNGAARRLFGRDAVRGLHLSHLVGSAGEAPLAAGPATWGEGFGPDGAALALELRVRRLRIGRRGLFCAYMRVRPERGGARSPAAAEALLASVAHELNNPLAILLAQATVLREVAPDPDIARRADRIAAAAQRAGRVLADLLAASREPARPAGDAVGGGRAVPPAPLSVMVVDDEEDVAASLADLLAVAGHAVTVETSPAAALVRAGQCRFDAVFADLRMPDLDGLALRDALARIDPGLAARTVIVTGDTVPRGGTPGREGAAKGLRLDKPFTMAGVRAVLDRIAAP